MSLNRSQGVSYDRTTRRDASKPRERETKISKTSSYSSKEDSKTNTDRYRGGSVDRRSARGTREDSKSRRPLQSDGAERPIINQHSQPATATLAKEKQKSSTHRDREAPDKLHRSRGSRRSDQTSRGKERYHQQEVEKHRREAEKRHTEVNKHRKDVESQLQKQSSRALGQGRHKNVEVPAHYKEGRQQGNQKAHGEGRRRTRTYSIEKELPLKNEKSSPKRNSTNHSNEKSPTHQKKTSSQEKETRERGKSARHSEKKSREKSMKSEDNNETVPSQKGFQLVARDENSAITKLEVPRALSPAVSDYNYEDDFEEYESDFEEDDDDDDKSSEDGHNLDESDHDKENEENSFEMKREENIMPSPIEINYKQASPQENRSVDISKAVRAQYSSKKLINPESDPLPKTESADKKLTRKSSSHAFINFQSAKQQQEKKRVEDKLGKRSQDLLEIITLDKVTYEVFEMPPINYDVYIRTFGQSNAKQVYVQTELGEDEEIQTEEIAIREKWTQMPAHDQNGVGGEMDEKTSETVSWKTRAKTNVIHLNNFIQNSGRLMLNVLTEELAEISQQKLAETYTSFDFSEGFIQIGSLPIQKDCPVTYLAFSSVQTNLLLTIHATSANPPQENAFADRGVICVWNINQPLEPEKILIATGQVSCCCFGPRSTSVVVSGMVDGSVSLWDLREYASWHPHEIIGEREWTLRTPTYSTASILKQEGHHSCVVAIKTLSQNSSDALSSPQRKQFDTDGCFHVITVEDLSVLNVWVVVEISRRDASGLEGDLGLAPWGRMKLVKSSSILLYSLPGLGDIIKEGVRSSDFSIVLCNPSHMLVTTDTGAVIHCSRFSTRISPKLYTADSAILIEARCIDFSPHSLPLFLVGSDDGSIRLHHIRSERALETWANTTKGKGVIKLKWSTSQPAVFYVLDANSCIYVWNLYQNLVSPIQTFELSDMRISCISLTNDSNINQETSSGWPPLMAIAREDGVIEIHQISKKYSSLSQSQYEKQKKCILNL